MKALIIIDMFNVDVHKRKDKNKLISNQLKLIEAFKKKSYKVIFTQGKLGVKPNPVMDKLWGDEYAGHGKNKEAKRKKFLWNIAIIDELNNSGANKIIHKEAYSAFYKTDLENYCKKNKINELYFCGISSGVCVYFSAADAVMRGIQPYLVTDASGSVSDKQHKININNFETVIGPALKTEDVLRRMG